MDWVGELALVGAAVEAKAAGHWFAARHRVRAGLVDAKVPEKLFEHAPVPMSYEGWRRLKLRFWSAAAPEQQEVSDPDEFVAMKALWSTDYGDRRQQLAIIGVDLNEASIRTRLDACLLTDEELALEASRWMDFVDPFPQWRAQLPEPLSASN